MGQPTEETSLLGRVKSPTSSTRRKIKKTYDNLGSNAKLTFSVMTIVLLACCCIIVTVAVTHHHMTTRLFTKATRVQNLSDNYDIIVVGGGPAGAVVSKLLSDDPWRRVLLIEAGNASQVDVGGHQQVNFSTNTRHMTPFDVPFYWTNVANTPKYHWDYPDVNVAKALGGCGIHNAMLYVRALPIDLERWGMGSKWTWKKALEIYMRMEDFDGPNVSYHGRTGIVRTSSAGLDDIYSNGFVEACEQVGIPRTNDFNAPNGRYGTGFYHFNTRNGIRDSAARTFLGPLLKPGQERPNFHLLLNSIVSRVVINDANVAEGVEIIQSDGTLHQISLSQKGQVIITAGAINTPKILMHSGIGHGEDLNDLDIPVKKHLPRVGMNLQDHPVLGMSFRSVDTRPFDLHAELSKYFDAMSQNKTNPLDYGLMGSAGISAGAFLIPPGSIIPEIQLTFFPRKSEPHVSNSSALNHQTEILFTVALLTPTARNRVILTSKNPNSSPRIVPEVPAKESEHLSSTDQWKLSWTITVVRQIAATMQAKGLMGSEILPGVQVNSFEDLNAYVRSAIFRNSHWVGSAAMGHTQEQAVVDEHLRVFGIQKLRVADASVIPVIPNGNVHSSVLMVASHAAEIIKEEEEKEKENVINNKKNPHQLSA